MLGIAGRILNEEKSEARNWKKSLFKVQELNDSYFLLPKIFQIKKSLAFFGFYTSKTPSTTTFSRKTLAKTILYYPKFTFSQHGTGQKILFSRNYTFTRNSITRKLIR